MKNKIKIVVPLKYLSNFWRSLELPLINCKFELSLKLYEKYLLTTANTATFKITDAKLYVPIVTLSVKGNAKLPKLLSEGFKRPIYWNEYKLTPNKIVEIASANDEKYIRELLDSSCQGVNKLFVLAYNNAAGNNQVSVDSYKKYFLPRLKIDNYNIKIETGKSDDYTTGCLLDFDYFEKNYRIIAADLSTQKALDADSRAIQQIIFTGKIKATVANARVIIFYVLAKLKETIFEFSKGTTEAL